MSSMIIIALKPMTLVYSETQMKIGLLSQIIGKLEDKVALKKMFILRVKSLLGLLV